MIGLSEELDDVEQRYFVGCVFCPLRSPINDKCRGDTQIPGFNSRFELQ